MSFDFPKCNGLQLFVAELVEQSPAFVGQLDGKLHAFVTVTADRALADAKAAEAALGRGDISSPLLGIPIGYKDIYATRGILTTGGSALLADWIPDEESTCGVRLQRAGTVMLGKLITHEFAFGIQFPGHRYEAARNPWDLQRMPGGSSSGSPAPRTAAVSSPSLPRTAWPPSAGPGRSMRPGSPGTSAAVSRTPRSRPSGMSSTGSATVVP